MFKAHAACLGIQQPQVSTDVFMFKPKFKLSLYWEASATWLYLIILALNAKKKKKIYWSDFSTSSTVKPTSPQMLPIPPIALPLPSSTP